MSGARHIYEIYSVPATCTIFSGKEVIRMFSNKKISCARTLKLAQFVFINVVALFERSGAHAYGNISGI